EGVLLRCGRFATNPEAAVLQPRCCMPESKRNRDHELLRLHSYCHPSCSLLCARYPVLVLASDEPVAICLQCKALHCPARKGSGPDRLTRRGSACPPILRASASRPVLWLRSPSTEWRLHDPRHRAEPIPCLFGEWESR